MTINHIIKLKCKNIPRKNLISIKEIETVLVLESGRWKGQQASTESKRPRVQALAQEKMFSSNINGERDLFIIISDHHCY